MERESLDIGIASMLEALNHTTGALCDVLFPPAGYCLVLLLALIFLYILFCILTIVFLQSLIAHSQGKSWFLCQQKETWERLIKEAWLCGEVIAQPTAAQ